MSDPTSSSAPPRAFHALQRVSAGAVNGKTLPVLDAATLASAQATLTAVRTGGESALLSIGASFGDIAPGQEYYLDKPAMEAVYNSLPPSQQELLQRVGARIRVFATAQRGALTDVTVALPGGGSAGHTVAPVAIAGCYAPGGRYPLPSSVLMTAITARVAGVGTVVVASPRPAPITIAAAFVAGADALLAVGGAQAIAALAYGAGRVPACDVIVGPGNRWVTAAKSLLSGHCGIDMLAGPSECCVLADGTGNPVLIAADLLAQAEHDVDALPVLVTTSSALADAVDGELRRQLPLLPTREVAAQALSKGFTVVVEGMEAAIAVVDKLAPEHLEVQCVDAEAVSRRVAHYGAVFIGGSSAEVFGDYGVGPNHVLPTSGTARYTGGLSVFTFLRVRTWLKCGEVADPASVGDCADLAVLEGLYGHEAAARARLL